MAKSREQETAVATTDRGGSVTKAQPVSIGQLASDASEFGMEFDRQDLAVPFLRIIQSNSPQVLQGKSEYMEEARPGMLFNTATRQLWTGSEGVFFLPVTYQRSFVEWTPRDKGGGFVKDHGAAGEDLMKTTQRNEKNKDILPNGNELVQGALYYGMIVDVDTGAFQQVALVLTGKQMKKSRKFNTALESATRMDAESGRPVKVPPFYRLWHFTTIPESNEKGNWFGFKIEPAAVIFDVANGELAYERAKVMFKQVRSGELKTQEPAENPDEPEDGKVPF